MEIAILVLVLALTLAGAVIGFLFWRYHVLARDFAKLAGMYALELHRGRVLADRAERAEHEAKWTGKQLDALLLVPQPHPLGDGATAIPKMIVIVDGKGA